MKMYTFINLRKVRNYKKQIQKILTNLGVILVDANLIKYIFIKL